MMHEIETKLFEAYAEIKAKGWGDHHIALYVTLEFNQVLFDKFGETRDADYLLGQLMKVGFPVIVSPILKDKDFKFGLRPDVLIERMQKAGWWSVNLKHSKWLPDEFKLALNDET